MRVAIKTCLIATLYLAGLAGPLGISAQEEFQPQQDDAPKAPEKKKSDKKLDFFYKASQGYLAGGSWLDVYSTNRNLNHPTMAYRSDNTFLMRYTVTEDGWARCLGNRNAFRASAANALLDVGVSELSRRWYRRGGRWRIAAISLNVAKATDSLVAGIQNERLNASIDQRVSRATGYRGVIVWQH